MILIFFDLDYPRMKSQGKSASHLMLGHLVITMHFLRLWHITSTSMAALVMFKHLFFYAIYLLCSLAEELLIDFRELIGEHSGENMAEVVWETLK